MAEDQSFIKFGVPPLGGLSGLDCLKAELRIQSSQIGLVPAFAVIQHWVLTPDFAGFVCANMLEVFKRAAIGPILPSRDVPMVHRVIVNVVQSSPAVPLIAHASLHAAVPDFPTPCFILAVPFEGGAAVEPSKPLERDLNSG